MIGQIDIEKSLLNAPNDRSLFVAVASVVNSLVDAVNTIQKEREAERFEIQEWIGILEAVRKSVNVHEKQIDELQTRSENVQPVAETRSENVQDKFAEQRKWIGKICKFWNWDTGLAHYSKLITIKDINDGEMSNCPFRADDGGWYMYCEPVKPDDDIIYRGE